jgi:hypothetical protein
MPPDDGLGLDEDQRRPPPLPDSGQQDPKHSIMGAEVGPLHASLHGSQLVAEGKILEDHVVVARQATVIARRSKNVNANTS